MSIYYSGLICGFCVSSILWTLVFTLNNKVKQKHTLEQKPTLEQCLQNLNAKNTKIKYTNEGKQIYATVTFTVIQDLED